MREIASLELSCGIKVHIQVINNRKLIITPVNAQYELLDEKGKLTKLDYKGQLELKKGSVLKIGKQKYKISEIKKSTSSNGYELYTFHKITTTGNFILPLLGGNRYSWKWNLEFTNAFISNEINYESIKLEVLYRFSGTKAFSDFEAELLAHPNFLEAVDTDKFHTLYKFKLPNEYSTDIQLILKGQYSKISEKAKARILEFHNSSRDKPIGQILFRCPKRKAQIEFEIEALLPAEAELYDMFLLENEIFKKQFIIEENATDRITSSFI